jgi:hypothetical protein
MVINSSASACSRRNRPLTRVDFLISTHWHRYGLAAAE